MVEAFQSKLDEIAQTQKGTLAAIQAQNKQIQTLLDNMNDTQKEMKNRLDAFATHIQVHGQKLMHIDTLMTKQAAEFDVAEDMRNAKPVPKLSVHAAIQGRAWLRDQNNKIFSVVEGDEIAGYGKVLTIDPRLGTVVTNSGQILRY